MKEKLPYNDLTFTKIGKFYSTRIGNFYNATNKRLKKGYSVKGVGQRKEYVTISKKNSK